MGQSRSYFVIKNRLGLLESVEIGLSFDRYHKSILTRDIDNKSLVGSEIFYTFQI